MVYECTWAEHIPIDNPSSFLINITTNNTQVLQGVINSVEEYGYLVNLGIKGVTAFLNKGDLSLKKCDIVSVVVKTVNDGSLILGGCSLDLTSAGCTE